MDSFYFTFGQSHLTTKGIPLKDGWIRVVAPSYWPARSIFVEMFSSVYMEAPDKWAFQYEESQMSKRYFPAGELGLIENGKLIIHFEHDE